MSHAISAAGTRLEQLLAQYAPAKAAAEEAAAHFKAVSDAIKAEAIASATAPGAKGPPPDITVSGAPHLPVLRVIWRQAWRLSTRRLKEEQPEIYARYAEKTGR